MFSMLYEANFTYDSSMPIYENKPPSFPYTMDYQLAHDCMIPPCPNRWRNHKPMKTDSDQGLPWGVGGSVGDVERPEGGTMQHGRCLQQPQHCRGKEHPLIWNQEALSITFFWQRPFSAHLMIVHLQGVYYMIMKNFQRHYNTNRAPFGLSYHPAWSVMVFWCFWMVKIKMNL